jgi:hypothetical protein
VAASRYGVHVETPFQGPARFEVVARSDRPGWKCQANPGTFTLQGFSSCGQDVDVRFDAPPGALPGQHALCQVEIRATEDGGKLRVVGGVAARTFVPRSCRTWGQLKNAEGKPIAGARVVLEPSRIPGAPAGTAPKPLDARAAISTPEGVFSARVVPGVPNRVSVDAGAAGKGAVLVRPECGLGLPGLVLGRDGLRTEPADAELGAADGKPPFASPM